MKLDTRLETDYLVIGSGIAGLRAAIALAAAGRVLVLSKAELTESATQYAQGGIAAALSDEDQVGLHYQDTLKAGAGLCDPEAVQILVEEGPRCIQELIEWGTAFDREGTRLAFTREGAHSRSRVLHAQGDSTGREILRVLFARAQGKIELTPFLFSIDLLLQNGRVTGVRCLDERTGTEREIRSQAVLLATGGLGQVYSETTNPTVATGDGVAIAHRAGALLQDMEFVQFHPTALHVPGAPRFLLSEALRGEGAYLRNLDLEQFMSRYHEAGELAPRDIVSRGIVKEMERTGSEFVYLDLTHLDPERVRLRFPRIHATCQQYSLDITRDLIPVRPAAHYSMGGVATDYDGRTSLAGLYAAGEVACNGVHGANRLASNSLLEGLVFGARAGCAILKDCPAQPSRTKASRDKAARNNALFQETNGLGREAQSAKPRACMDSLRRAMWDKVSILRNAASLGAALRVLEQMPPPEATGDRAYYEEQNLRLVAEVVARSALAREESRGAHYRSDFPLQNDAEWKKHSRIARAGGVRFT